MELPHVVSLAARPGPPLPTKMANGAPLPTSVYNPFNPSAPAGTIERAAREITTCVAALLDLPVPAASDKKILIVHFDRLTSGSTRALDDEMEAANLWGFIVCTERDVLLAGLTAALAADAFTATAERRGAQDVAANAPGMADLIRAAAEQAADTYAHQDAYTTGFGYSCAQAARKHP